MASVVTQLIEEVIAHAQSDSLVDVQEICADGTYFPNNLRIFTLILFSPCIVNDYNILVPTNAHIILIYISLYLAATRFSW